MMVGGGFKLASLEKEGHFQIFVKNYLFFFCGLTCMVEFFTLLTK